MVMQKRASLLSNTQYGKKHDFSRRYIKKEIKQNVKILPE